MYFFFKKNTNLLSALKKKGLNVRNIGDSRYSLSYEKCNSLILPKPAAPCLNRTGT